MTHSARQIARKLGKKNDFFSLFLVARSWVFLMFVIVLALKSESILIGTVCFFLIGGLQYGLLILMHDAQHRLVHSDQKVNDLIGAWILGAPHGSLFFSSMRQHMDHHLNFGHESDPSYSFYCYGQPSPKNNLKNLAMHFLSTMLIGRFIYSLSLPSLAKTIGEKGQQKGRLSEYARVALVQSLIFSMFSILGFWWAYFVLWLLPIITLVSFFDAFRIFCEHAQPYEGATKTERFITTKSNYIEQFFIAPFNMNLHAEHHLFPGVPHYNLQSLSRIMKDSDEFPNVEWRNHSYFTTFLRYAGRVGK